MEDQSNNIKGQISSIMLYQILSKLMILFKKLFCLLQRISTLKSRAFPIQDSISQISNLFKQIEQLISPIPQQASAQINKTFQRFICRMIQTIHFHRHKFMQLSMSSVLIQLTNQLQNNFSSFNKDSNLPKSMKKTLKIINKYYKINPEVSPRKINLSTKKINQQNNFYVTVAGQQFRTKKIENKSQTSLSKALMGINTYFRITSCLGLDYKNFRNTSFQAITNHKQVYDDTYQRNIPIKRIMTQYSKQFTQYLKRKQNKKIIIRKSKFFDPESPFHTKTLFESQKNILQSKNNFGKNTISNFKGSYFVRKKKSQIIQLEDRQFIENQFQSQDFIMSQTNSPTRIISDKRDIALTLDQRSKFSYQMKQVVISASKLKLNSIPKHNINHTISIPQKDIKNKSIETSTFKLKKEKKLMNPSQLYFTRLKKNLQKIKNNHNNILIKVQKQDDYERAQLIIQ